MSETYGITDAKYYDASSSSNVSRYTKSGNGSLSYDSNNSAYLFNSGGGGNTWQWTNFTLDNVPFPNNSTIKAKVKFLTSRNTQVWFGLRNINNLAGRITFASDGNDYGLYINEINPELSSVIADASSKVTSSDIQTNVWYDVEVVYTSFSCTFSLYNGSTLVTTVYLNNSSLDSTNNTFVFIGGLFTQSQILIKDITIL